MAIFIYEAQDEQGRLVRGQVEAPNDVKATEILRDRQLLVLSLKPRPPITEALFTFFKRVSVRDKAVFARQLSTMVSAGLSITQALRILAEQTENVNLKKAIGTVIADVEEGFSFSMAIARHPYIFSSFFINMLRSGEASGNLDRVLLVLATQQEKDAAINARVRGALLYPAFIMVALFVVGVVMMIYVVPNLKSVFTESGAQLPIMTRILLWLADFLKVWWWLVFLALFGSITGLRFWVSTPGGKVAWNYFQLKIPIFKNFYKYLYVARFTRTTQMLIFSGVPILETLNISADVIDNFVFETALRDAAAQVEKGVPLSMAIRQTKSFPPMVSHMTAVGEQTGKIDYMLGILADFYETEAEQRVKEFSTLLEPLIILVMGLAVAFLLFAIMIPLYNVTQQAGG